MQVLRFARRIAVAIFATLLLASTGQAANVFISSTGNDANPCSITAPCRSLQKAVDVAVAGSNVIVLDTAGYGANVVIGKSVSIIAEGAVASLLPGAGSAAVTVNGAGIVVTLRGLALNGQGVGAHGMSIVNAAAVQIENCTIERFANNGILLINNNAELFVADTISRDNAADGLFVPGTGTTAKLTVVNSHFENNGDDGLDVEGIQSAVTRTVLSGNGGHGFELGGGSANVTTTSAVANQASGYLVGIAGQMALERSVARGNAASGLLVLAGAGNVGIASNSVFTNNAVGLRNNGGGAVLRTRQNNTVSGNTTNTIGALTPLAGT
ncbi:MAG: right-handed parallel beta-helix repeat-containing protein [Propylenella sp.]